MQHAAVVELAFSVGLCVLSLLSIRWKICPYSAAVWGHLGSDKCSYLDLYGFCAKMKFIDLQLEIG